MAEKGVAPCATTYNTLLDGLFRAGHATNAYRMFRYLQRVGLPIGIVVEISDSSASGGRSTTVQPNFTIVTYNTMINGLCRSGKVGSARMVLKELGRAGHAPNVITYTTVMKCCFRYGRFHQGLETFLSLLEGGYISDAFPYCTVISALVKKGRMQEANTYCELVIQSGSRFNSVCSMLQHADSPALLRRQDGRCV
ncbi:hypothetical protein EJB05_53169, partial [Eragrostis curvula]